ncbi:MAG: hypothetical protein HQ509_11615 [Candidatus Marinimicrobia bacterium]|nr:hypothetical protein [Candidatus Neomarinimicrobiota bacterium]
MKNRLNLHLVICFFVFIVTTQSIFAQGLGGDLLNEAPLVPIPQSMTFEEYRDMNRRLSVGIALAAIPIPGMIHYYAGEKRTAKIIFGTAMLGIGSIVIGASGLEEGDFPDSDFGMLILNADDQKRERRYEKIPISITNTDTTYKLKEIFRKQSGGSGGLILLGAALIVGDILYDYIHGIRTIETKRDRVRYKYGQTLEFSVKPTLDPYTQSAGLSLSWSF